METSSRKQPVDPSATAGEPKQLRLRREAETPGTHYHRVVTEAHAEFSSSQGTSDRQHLHGFLSEALIREFTSPQEAPLEHDRTLAEQHQQTRLQPHFQHVPKRSASSKSSTSTASTVAPPPRPAAIKATTQGIDLQAPGRNPTQVIY